MKKMMMAVVAVMAMMSATAQSNKTTQTNNGAALSQQEIINNLKATMQEAASQSATNAQQKFNDAAEQAKASAAAALQNAQQSGANALSNVMQNVNTATDQTAKGDLLSFVKSLAGTSLSPKNLAGDWKYTAPAVQFESENVLASAGGLLAAQTVASKLEGVFVKLGIKSGSMNYVFAEDGSFTGTMGGRAFKGRYEIDDKAKTVKLTYLSSLNLPLLTFKVDMKLSAEGMNMLFDADNLLKLFKVVVRVTGNSTLNTLGNLADSYDGMKVGFKFVR